jgi:hypothetical protein
LQPLPSLRCFPRPIFVPRPLYPSGEEHLRVAGATARHCDGLCQSGFVGKTSLICGIKISIGSLRSASVGRTGCADAPMPSPSSPGAPLEPVKIVCEESGWCYRPAVRRPVARWVYRNNIFYPTYMKGRTFNLIAPCTRQFGQRGRWPHAILDNLAINFPRRWPSMRGAVSGIVGCFDEAVCLASLLGWLAGAGEAALIVSLIGLGWQCGFRTCVDGVWPRSLDRASAVVAGALFENEGRDLCARFCRQQEMDQDWPRRDGLIRCDLVIHSCPQFTVIHTDFSYPQRRTRFVPKKSSCVLAALVRLQRLSFGRPPRSNTSSDSVIEFFTQRLWPPGVCDRCGAFG